MQNDRLWLTALMIALNALYATVFLAFALYIPFTRPGALEFKFKAINICDSLLENFIILLCILIPGRLFVYPLIWSKSMEFWRAMFC